MRNIAIALGSICIVLAAGGCQTVEFDDPALLGSAEESRRSKKKNRRISKRLKTMPLKKN